MPIVINRIVAEQIRSTILYLGRYQFYPRARHIYFLAFEEVFYRENIWPFLVQYNDTKWYESIVARSNEFFVTFLKEYEKTGGDVQFHLDKPEIFDRKKATNTTSIYKIILKGTGDSQYRIYSSLNSKLQEALRKEYHIE